MIKKQQIINKSDLKKIVTIASETIGIQLYIPPIKFFLDSTEDVAKKLLGTYLLHTERRGKKLEIIGGKIVETEAYLDKMDPASHAATAKITARNKIFYATGGVSYVFHARGIYYCFNVIVRPKNLAGCVLVRALEPIMGIEIMAQRRSKSPEQIYDLCSGPSKICQALGINHLYTGCDLRRSELLILIPKNKQKIELASGPRIGISKAIDWPLRFWGENSKFISK